MKRYCILAVLVIVALSGCGGGGGGSSSTGGDGSVASSSSSSSTPASNNSNSTAPGSLQVQVTNPALPSATVNLTYTIVGSSGNTVLADQFAYSGGMPPLETFTNIPSDTDTVTVQALDANGDALIVGSNQVTINVSAEPTVFVTVGNPTAVAAIQFASQPSNVVAGANESNIVVGLIDASNNLAVSSTAEVSLALGSNPGGSTASGTLTVSPVSGLATFTVISLNNVANGYTFVASSPGVPSITTNPFNVVATAGAATQLVFTVEPFLNTTINIPFAPAPQVGIEDARSVIVNTANNPIALAIGANPGGSALAGTTTVAATAGLSTFNGISINGQGTGYTFVTSSPGLVQATSIPFNVLFDQSGATPPSGGGGNGDGCGLCQ